MFWILMVYFYNFYCLFENKGISTIEFPVWSNIESICGRLIYLINTYFFICVYTHIQGFLGYLILTLCHLTFVILHATHKHQNVIQYHNKQMPWKMVMGNMTQRPQLNDINMSINMSHNVVLLQNNCNPNYFLLCHSIFY